MWLKTRTHSVEGGHQCWGKVNRRNFCEERDGQRQEPRMLVVPPRPLPRSRYYTLVFVEVVRWGLPNT